jgi:hypothetical protein
MSENNGNGEHKKEVKIYVDEAGDIRTVANPGMTYFEVYTLLNFALETVAAKMQERSKVVIPRPIGLVDTKRS